MKNIIISIGIIAAIIGVGIYITSKDSNLTKDQIPFGTNTDLIGGDAEPGSPLDDVVLNGVGTEPFWSFEYIDGQLTWSMPMADEIGNIESITYSVGFARDGSDYKLWGLGDSNVQVEVNEGACSDGMSDRVYTHRVSALLNGMEYRGCAYAL